MIISNDFDFTDGIFEYHQLYTKLMKDDIDEYSSILNECNIELLLKYNYYAMTYSNYFINNQFDIMNKYDMNKCKQFYIDFINKHKIIEYI